RMGTPVSDDGRRSTVRSACRPPWSQQHDVTRGDPAQFRKEVTLLDHDQFSAQRIDPARLELARTRKTGWAGCKNSLQLVDAHDGFGLARRDHTDDLGFHFQRWTEPLLNLRAARQLERLAFARS